MQPGQRSQIHVLPSQLAGEDILVSGRNVRLDASDLTARDSLHVAASGHFSLGFLAESNETSHWQRSSGGMFRKTKTREGYSLDVTPRTARYTSRLRSQSSGV